MDYGREFGPCLRGMPPSGLHNDFIFQKRNPDGGYENTGCRIGKISNYKWVTVY
jgi:hypothetical protein